MGQLWCRIRLALIGGIAAMPILTSAVPAQDWSPFDPFKNPARGTAERRAQPPAPSAGEGDVILRPLGNEPTGAIERSELAPVMAADGSGLPYELWRGLDAGSLSRLVAEIEIPPRSPALQKLWLKLITSGVTLPEGGVTDRQFVILRIEMLFRSGQLAAASRLLADTRDPDAALSILGARTEIGLGNKARACTLAGSAAPGGLPEPLRGDAALISGYCAAVAGDAAGAGLAAELAREQGVKEGAALAALDAIAAGAKLQLAPRAEQGDRLSLLDYRLVELAGGSVEPGRLVRAGEPSLLAALAIDKRAEPARRLAAAEAAVAVNAITADDLADVYRVQAAASAVVSDAAGTDTPERRATLFVAAEHEYTPQKKVRLIRAFLDEARRAGFYLSALRMIAPASATIVAAPEIGWYAETGVEVALAAGSYDKAREWAAFGGAPNGAAGDSLNHWLALVDIAEGAAAADGDFTYVQQLATSGQLDPNLLHRLATVLDALDYNVPIPLWEATSRAPQPSSGYLPETGVLSELQDAAKQQQFGRMVLLCMKTIGPGGPAGAHMIALGDSIRALKRAHQEEDARSLGFEALFASWPRSIVN